MHAVLYGVESIYLGIITPLHIYMASILDCPTLGCGVVLSPIPHPNDLYSLLERISCNFWGAQEAAPLRGSEDWIDYRCLDGDLETKLFVNSLPPPPPLTHLFLMTPHYWI